MTVIYKIISKVDILLYKIVLKLYLKKVQLLRPRPGDYFLIFAYFGSGDCFVEFYTLAYGSRFGYWTDNTPFCNQVVVKFPVGQSLV